MIFFLTGDIMMFFLTRAIFSSVNILRSLTGVIQKSCGDIVTAIIRNIIVAIIQSTVGYEVSHEFFLGLVSVSSLHSFYNDLQVIGTII
ncbi:hypothetical protein QYE76_047484 [Lolium multiflorum]|uniref:Uncharacterized protein n=1 Tax=Lolium multiflorum TaxID=4521 RepID=A0AAD8TS11_LOLMU|nr:hypothetical protein QYE76_047484 [Lolium multiflorum]